MDDYAAKATDEAIKKLERHITKLYTQAQKDIEEKTKSFWERHRVKDAIYQQQLKDGKITKEDYQAWLRGQVFQGKQWSALTEQVQSALSSVNKQALNIVNNGRIDVFATNANWQAYQIEKSAGVNFGFGIYDSSTVTRLLRDEPDLLPARKLNTSKDKKWNKGNITRQISQGIIQGEKLDSIAKRLREVTNMNKTQSLTNARTTMTGAQNAGRQESYQRAQKMGIKVRKTWVATLDGHTRTNHRKLDGQTVDIDEPFKMGGYSIMYPGDRRAKPEMVYNCRCTMISEVVDYPSENAQRYDNVTGKPIKDMTYDEWARSKNTKPARKTNTVNNLNRVSQKQSTTEDWYSDESLKSRIKDTMEYSGLKNVDDIGKALYGYNGDTEYCYFNGADTDIRGRKTEEASAMADAIQKYIDLAPKYEGKIYRGMAVDDATLDAIKPGTKFNESRYAVSSWSSREDVGQRYANNSYREVGGNRVVFEYSNPTHGTPVSHLSMYPTESEVLVNNRDVEYVVVSVEEYFKKDRKYIRVVLKEV